MSIQIKLNKKEVLYLESQKKLPHLSARKYNRINILLLLSKGKKTSEIEDFLAVDRITVWKTKMKYLEQGIENALIEEERSGQPVKYNTDHESELAALDSQSAYYPVRMDAAGKNRCPIAHLLVS
jgi:putative transposase